VRASQPLAAVHAGGDDVQLTTTTRLPHLNVYVAPITLSAMCMQCMAGAMVAGAGATGMRAWLIACAPLWLTPGRRQALTRGLLVAGVIGAGLIGTPPA
jgi:hypothetical protein